KKPIYILENGVPDREDRIRPWVIESIGEQMRMLLAEGIDLRGYFHWTLVDNFEWTEGWHLRFGLYQLDPVTQKRTARPSAQEYAKVIRESRGLVEAAENSTAENGGEFAPQTNGAGCNGSHQNGNGESAELSSGMVTENESGFSQ